MPRPTGPLLFRASLSAYSLPLLVLLVLGSGGTGRYIASAQSGELTAVAGSYAVAISDDDVPLSLIGSATLIGAWVVDFGADGSYQIARQDVGAVVMGRYEVSGGDLTITDESGLLSCANAQPIGETQPVATYAWQKAGDQLRLESDSDGCATRRVLLGTRPLSPFVACRTVADELPASGTPAADGATSGMDRGLRALQKAENDGATPESNQTGDADATPVAAGTPAPIGVGDDPEQAIADLIGQLNACWATGDPARVLPLFSQVFLDDATGGGAATLDDLAGQLRQLQTSTIAWELAGDIEVNGDEATAVVAATIGGEEMLKTFAFVREDGAWRLDNLGE